MRNTLRCVLLVGLMSHTQLVSAQVYPWNFCSWNSGPIPVRYNAGTAAAAGFDPNKFLGDLIDAMGTWNAEAMANYDLVYDGTTSATGHTANRINVINSNNGGCMTGNLAANASVALSGNCAPLGGKIEMHMVNACNPSQPRQWFVGWAPLPTHTQGITGATSYEAVMTHELGHMFGLNDVPLGTAGPGIMNGAPVTNALTAWLHLYPIDRNSIVALGGATARRPRTSTSVTGTQAWSIPTFIVPAGVASTSPSLDGNRPSSGTYPLSAITSTVGNGADYAVGNTGWADRPNPTATTAMPLGVANSTFGETMVVWGSDCNVDVNGCDVAWAWTNNDGTSWTTGTYTTADTFTKPFVEYDSFRDRFVLAYIGMGEQRLYLTSAPAASAPGWDPTPMPGYSPMRHLGGLIFDGSTGLMVASSGWGGDKGRILQFNITHNGSDYVMSGANYLTNTDSRTRRPFGIARDGSHVVVVWRDTGAGRDMFGCAKTGLSASIRCATPTHQVSAIVNGVDLAFNPSTNRFVAGFSQ